jgi:hypothetical protein
VNVNEGLVSGLRFGWGISEEHEYKCFKDGDIRITGTSIPKSGCRQNDLQGTKTKVLWNPLYARQELNLGHSP